MVRCPNSGEEQNMLRRKWGSWKEEIFKKQKKQKKKKKKKTMCFLDVLGENQTLLKLFTNYVATNLNMFYSFMKSWIDCYMKSWFVITIK